MPPKKKEASSQGGKQQALLSKFFASKPTTATTDGDNKATAQPPAPSARRGKEHEAELAHVEPATSSKRDRESDVEPAQNKKQKPNLAPDVKRAAKARSVLDPPVPDAPEKIPSSMQTPKPKYTPLEARVLEIKNSNPGVLLLVEVGYKFRLFGQDAAIASQVCNIYSHQDHNFLTASFPVYRLPVYTRRLVNAGYKVGVVRQVESAALKAQSSTRSAPFERKLTALYTAATLDAAQRAEKIGEEGSLEEFAELDDAASSKGGGVQPRYILFVAEGAQGSGTEAAEGAEEVEAREGEAAGEACSEGGEGLSEGGGDEAMQTDELSADAEAGEGIGAQGKGQQQRQQQQNRQKKRGGSSKGAAIGGNSVKAKGRGEVQVALVAVECSTGDVQQGMCSVGDSGCELEAALIALAPAELIVVPPLSSSAMRMLQAYASASPGCRVDHIGPVATSPAKRGAPKQAGSNQDRQEEARMAILTDMFAGDDASLQALLSFPSPILRALAAAATHLSSFGLEAVLRAKASPGAKPADSQQPSLFRELSFRQGMRLTANAMRQLEVLAAGPPPGTNAGSLLHLLDRTHTPTGSRLLREWVVRPLTELPAIQARLDAVEELAAGARGPGPLSRLNGALRHLPDIERGLLRALHSTAPPAEFVATIQALQRVPSQLGFEFDPISGSVSGMLGSPPKAGQANQPSDAQGQDAPQQQEEEEESREGRIAHVVSPLLTRMLQALASVDVQCTCRELLGALDTRAARENRTIDMFTDKERFSEVFERRQDVSNAIAKLKSLLPRLAKELGVRSLDYVSIQNQGDWLIEVPKDQLQKVPRSWHQICATQKVARYHPPAVRDAINELLVAKERLAAAASAAWFSFLKNDFGVQHYAQLKAAATALSHLDALSSLAAVSKAPNYCRPTFAAPGSPPKLVIRGGRHPMLEAQLAGGKGATTAVPNDLELRSDGVRAAVITGPNMGGKSCLIRQAALTAIMAQIGSFVPADSCELSVCDGVYTRMGASDNLLLGRSTFMEELSDAADTLANATCHSLVIMDELGRGTATHDGVAIAQATLTHLVHTTGCLSLFVTHYPEVAQLADSAVRAYHMAYLKCDDPEEDEAHEDLQQQGSGSGCAEGAGSGMDASQGGDQQADENGLGELQLSGSAAEGQDGGDGAGAGNASGGSQGVNIDTETRGAAASLSPSASRESSGGPKESPLAPAVGLGVGKDAARGAATAAAAGATRITFLYRLQEGAADASFGLNVAAMAGLPNIVVQRAALRASELRQAIQQGKEAMQQSRIGAATAAGEAMDCNGQLDWKAQIPGVVESIRKATSQGPPQEHQVLSELKSIQRRLQNAQH